MISKCHNRAKCSCQHQQFGGGGCNLKRKKRGSGGGGLGSNKPQKTRTLPESQGLNSAESLPSHVEARVVTRIPHPSLGPGRALEPVSHPPGGHATSIWGDDGDPGARRCQGKPLASAPELWLRATGFRLPEPRRSTPGRTRGSSGRACA